MSQHDMVIANDTFPNTRADINAALLALASNSAGSSAPASPTTYQMWLDSSGTPWILKMYDGTDWITLLTVNAADNVLNDFVIGASKMFVGDTSNADMGVGLTINQGAGDDEIVALKSSDIAHGMTDLAETDTFASFRKYHATIGGAALKGFGESSYGLGLFGAVGADNTTKSNAALGAIMMNCQKKSGTSVGANGANANLVTICDGAGAAKHIFDFEGDIHVDGSATLTVFDAVDDGVLMAGLRGSFLPPAQAAQLGLAQFIEEARPALEANKIVTYNENGHHFLSLKGGLFLALDGARQAHTLARVALAALADVVGDEGVRKHLADAGLPAVLR